jgi:hypothetical protein
MLKECALLLAWTLVLYMFVTFLDSEVEMTPQAKRESTSLIYGYNRSALVVNLSNRELEKIDCDMLEKFTNLRMLCKQAPQNSKLFLN